MPVEPSNAFFCPSMLPGLEHGPAENLFVPGWTGVIADPDFMIAKPSLAQDLSNNVSHSIFHSTVFSNTGEN